MGWDAWMRVQDWVLLGGGCLLGVFSLLALSTRMLDARWARRPSGIKRGRLYAKGSCLMSLALIANASFDLFVSAKWLAVILLVFQFACLGGCVWLWVVANRVTSESPTR
ncbi:hypothetical protein [Nonomuraea cavernae]|uniref:DUF3325 domain-containing protein n=1 Tax=Nonomuraea cavernae TaxID=2045107 RepID=A0A917Z0J6_9ACTN|nr:hypothetical protein [Nonomuraea cavernae]MCA2187639.1 hypothetical protein [Nonomuraea cavernae]GGO70950.1 hypothetical protein GCM10012289_35580 [Nonomuraea cavernae]